MACGLWHVRGHSGYPDLLLLGPFHWEALPRKLGAPVLPSAVIVEIEQVPTRRRGFWTSWARLRFSVGRARKQSARWPIRLCKFALPTDSFVRVAAWDIGLSRYGFRTRSHDLTVMCTTHPQCIWQTTFKFSTARLSSQYCSEGAPMKAKAAHRCSSSFLQVINDTMSGGHSITFNGTMEGNRLSDLLIMHQCLHYKLGTCWWAYFSLTSLAAIPLLAVYFQGSENINKPTCGMFGR